jgi:muramoyltetrapeptide carboxypeptidase
MIKARALQQNDLVGVVAPAGPLLDPGALTRGVRILEAMGFRVVLGNHINSQYRYLAGTDAERTADLMGMFADPAIKAIVCLRGGYGSPRILPRLDYGLIRDNPKVFVGYSDITALHAALIQKAGLITFLGPMVAPDFGGNLSQYTRDSFSKAITCRAPLGLVGLPPEARPPTVITPGRAVGKLVGGNLSLLAALEGTPFAPDTTGALLLLEEVGEDPYRIDRMLTQLKQSGRFDTVAGIVIGECVACSTGMYQTAGQPAFTLEEMFHEHLGALGAPCLYGLPLGHGAHKATVPLGLTATLDTAAGTVAFAEAAGV